ncbi:MAG: hypothetical protein IIU59_03780, partial [Alistipes sp.]|nr:hypothetical protein [Alistipes sp.]
MKKLIVLMMLMGACLTSVMAQSQQELIEAYRNGVLTQSQIDNAQKQRNATSVNRLRSDVSQVNVADDVRFENDKSTNTEDNDTHRDQIDKNSHVYKEFMKLQQREKNPLRGKMEVEKDAHKRDSLLRLMPELAYIDEFEVNSRIFGYDLFSNRSLTFEPNLNIATPDNYVLGPGDEVIIDTWGDAHTSQAYTI